jgi:AN1-type zinc finger protein 5/6
MDAAPGSSNSLSTSPISGISSASPSSSPQTDATRCWECKKKVGLLGIKCRCNYIYCSKHRYSDQHNCQFDFKAREKDLLKQRLVQVAGEKITKI